MLGDLHGVERRADAEVVGAAEQRESIVTVRHLADTADERHVETGSFERARVDVVRGVVAKLDAGGGTQQFARVVGVIGRSNSATSTTAWPTGTGTRTAVATTCRSGRPRILRGSAMILASSPV